MAYQDTRVPRPERSSFGPLAALIGAAAFVLVGWAVWEALDDPGEQGVGLTIGKVVEDPAQYEGQLVTLTGEVEDIISSSSFLLAATAGHSGTLLILDAGAALGDLEERDAVEVSGHLRVFDDRVANRAQLGGDELEEWRGKPVLMATSFTELPDRLEDR